MSSMFVKSSIRMHDDGQPYPTACFTAPLSEMPHHHYLICGHHIQTRIIQKCGSNCRPAETAEQKVQEPPFACPDTICTIEREDAMRKNKIFMPKPGQKRVQPRPCILSHVYGINEVADTARHEEKVQSVFEGLCGLGVEQERKKYRNRLDRIRVRSRSPTIAEERRTAELTATRKARVMMDEAEIINILAQSDDGFKAAMKFTGPGVRKKTADGARFKTRAELDEEVKDASVSRALDQLSVVGNPALMERLKVARRREMALKLTYRQHDIEFGEVPNTADPGDLVGPGIDLHKECDRCAQAIYDVAFKCKTCLDFNFCNDCMMYARHTHTKRHQFELVKAPLELEPGEEQPPGDEVDGLECVEVSKEPVTFCKCQTTSAKNLVSCEDCDTRFHPGCFGLGNYEDAAYADEAVRHMYFRRDYQKWKTEGVSFKCEACNDIAEDAEEESKKSKDARAARAEKLESTRADRMKREKAARYYRPEQTVQKRVEMKKAKTPAAKAAVEAKWDAIISDQMEVEGQNEDDDIPLPTFENLVYRLKPGMG